MVNTQAGARFDGKVVVVTGASAGMGLAAAELLGSDGAKVVAVARNEDKLAEAKKAITAAGAPAVLTVSADVSTEAGNKVMIEAAVAEFGEIHALFANAGSNAIMRFCDATESSVDALFNLNTKSVIFSIKYAMEAMKANGTKGSIVVNSSVMSHSVKSWAQGAGVYSATKAAVDMLVQYAAIEGAENGIRVNAIRPAIIATPLHNADTEPEKVEALAKDKQLARRAGTSQEVAKLAVFLLSDDASFVTGSLYDIDGGFALTAGVAPSSARTNLPPPESS